MDKGDGSKGILSRKESYCQAKGDKKQPGESGDECIEENNNQYKENRIRQQTIANDMSGTKAGTNGLKEKNS